MSRKTAIPFFGNPPVEYNQRFFADLVRNFSVFVQQERASNVDHDGTGSVNEVAFFTETNVIGGSASFTWNGTQLTVGGIIESTSGGIRFPDGTTQTTASAGGGGNVSNTGTPVNNQLAVWTNATTIEGDSNLTWDGQELVVTGNVEADEFIGDLRGATLFKAKAGEALAKGDVVYLNGISGNTTIVFKADADVPAEMPAFGVVAAAASINNPVDVYTSGILQGLNTSAFSEGDELFVSNTPGVLSDTPPTGESSQLQKLAKVTQSHASAGSIFIMGAGRTNAVPNLNTGRLFVGNSSNQAVADGTLYVDIANSRVGIGTTSTASPLTVAGVIESTSGGFKFPDGTTQTTASSGSGSVAFNDLTSKTGGTGEYSTSGNLTSGRASGGVSLTINDGGGNANLTFNHKSRTPEQTGNAGRIRVNTDSTTGGVMEFQVGSGLTSGVAADLSTYFKIEENLLTSNAVLNMPDSKAIKLGTGNDFIMQFNGTETLFNAVAGDVYFQDNSTTVMRQTGSNMRMYDSRNLQFGTGGDWAFQYNGTDAYMDLDSGTWRWRDGANGNAIRVQWTPSAGLEFQDGHQLQLGTSNDLRMYHSSDINYFDLVNGDLKIRDVSGTATDRFILGQGGDLYVQGNVGIGTTSPEESLHIATVNPSIRFEDTNAAANAKQWIISGGNTNLLRFQALNDADGGGGHFFQFERSANLITQFVGVKSGTGWFTIHNSDERVGIGTTTPSSPLTVTGIIESTSGGIKFPDGTTQTTAGGGGGGNVSNTGTPANNQIAVWTDATTIEGDADLRWTGTQLEIETGTTDRTLLSLVYQGTAAPNRTFQIKSPPADNINSAFEIATSNAISFAIDATERFRINDNGRIGIGTSSPSEALEVSGTVKATEMVGRIVSGSTTTGTVVLSDANKKITMTGNMTVPSGTFAQDDTILFDGNGTARTLTPASGLTIYVNGTAVTNPATVAIPANGIVGLTFRSGTVAIATGVDPEANKYYYSATSTDTTTNHNASFTPTVVDFNSQLLNQGSFTESGGRITVPVAGVYRIYGQVTFTRGGTEQRLSLQLQIFKNATAESGRGRGSYIRGASNVDDATAYIEDFVNCAASDILDIRAFRDGVAGTSILNVNQSRLLIEKL